MKIIRSRCCLIIAIFHIFFVSAFSISAKFTYAKRSNCSPTVVEFTNNSTTGTNISYTWNFGLGALVTTSDHSTKEQVYTKPGKYKVTLIVSDGTNKDSTSTIVTISQGPKASFTASKTIGCKPLLVTFTSTSVKGDTDIANTSWDFRNGDYGSGTSITYTYNNTGKYDVVLTVTDKNGCSSYLESDSLINVVNKPTVNFSATDTFACSPPLNVTFVNLSTGASDLTYLWNYGNGKTSTDLSNSSVYNSKGSYNVTLTATDQYGCSSSLTKESYIKIGNASGTISVYDSKNNIVTKSKLCSGTYKFVFSIDNLPDYTWTILDNNNVTKFTGQNSITYLVTDTGTIDVKLTYGKNSFCTDSIDKSYKKSFIKANFTLDKTIFCSLPQKINLQNASTNASGSSWFFSNHLFSNNSDTSFTITQNDVPGKTYQQLYSHEISKIQLPIKLVATNSEGCVDSITQETIFSLPIARFMPDKVSGCAPLQVSFSDSSKSAYTIDEYIYEIGSNSVTSTSKSPISYTFTKPGEYYVSEVIKSGGCSDTSKVVKIVVGDKLTPDFTITPSEICNGGKIHIVGSTNNNSVVKTWHFKFLNIFDYNFTTKPDTNITVYTDTAGSKNVTLQVDYNGCFSEITKNAIFKITGSVGDFTESFTCDSSLVYHFKSKISPASSLLWNVDTAVFNNVDSLRYKFPKSGDYTVKLSVTDNSSGCILTRTKIIKVRQVKANFTVNDSIFCAGDSTLLNSSLSKDYINTCYNEGFYWDFGDNSQPKRTFTTTFNHIYTSKGKFKLLLIAKAENGCVDSIQKNIYVYKPVGSFTTDKKSGCLTSLNVNFNNTSTDTTIVNWIWNFGDGSTDSTKSIKVLHTYTSDVQKTFNPSLTVYDAYQCHSNYAIPITLIGINSDFQTEDNAICAGQTVTFLPFDKSIDTLSWNFGDGSTSTTSNSHTYTKYGQYTVSLTATKDGCSGTVTKTNYVSVEKADASFSVSDSILSCYPDTLYFIHHNLNASPVVDRLWTFDSHELTGKNSDTIKYVYTRPGNYATQLTVRTLNGCKASSSKNIVITGPSATFSFSPKKICYNEIVNFQADSLNNVSSWKWLFGDGNTSTVNPTSHRYSSRGKIVPAILLMNNKCSVTKTIDTLSISMVKANFSSAGDSSKICDGNKINLVNKSTYSEYWNWEINNVLTSNDFNVDDVSLSKIGTNSIKLIAFDADNCSDTLVKNYTVVASPVFTIAGDSILCKNQSSIVLTVNKESGWKIKWTPTTGLSDPLAFTTTAQPTSTITYIALVTDTNGCATTRKKTIVLNQPFNFSRIPIGDTTINIGEKIRLIILTDSSNVTYAWSPNYNISCLNCSSPYVAPTKDFTYQVELKNSCFDFIENFTIKVLFDFYLEAPSAFTPNEDSNNDVFKFEEKNIKSFDLKIFNRWGKIVFSTNNVLEGWDGKVDGHLQNIDTYTYYVKAESMYGYKFEKKGNFLLLK